MLCDGKMEAMQFECVVVLKIQHERESDGPVGAPAIFASGMLGRLPKLAWIWLRVGVSWIRTRVFLCGVFSRNAVNRSCVVRSVVVAKLVGA